MSILDAQLSGRHSASSLASRIGDGYRFHHFYVNTFYFVLFCLSVCPNFFTRPLPAWRRSPLGRILNRVSADGRPSSGVPEKRFGPEATARSRIRVVQFLNGVTVLIIASLAVSRIRADNLFPAPPPPPPRLHTCPRSSIYSALPIVLGLFSPRFRLLLSLSLSRLCFRCFFLLLFTRTRETRHSTRAGFSSAQAITRRRTPRIFLFYHLYFFTEKTI